MKMGKKRKILHFCVFSVSIARRVQDPLAELVKIEPKHIGVGMYKFGKLSSGHRTGKGQFSFQP